MAVKDWSGSKSLVATVGSNFLPKDWTGNKRSVFATLGASSHAKHTRQENDFYATDPKALVRFLDAFECKLPKRIWEPACGQGHISKVLAKRGHKVYSSDLHDYGYGEVKDFLLSKKLPKKNCIIITNPPYKYALDFVTKSLSLLPDKGMAIFFLRVQFLEGNKRKKILYGKNNCLRYVYVHSRRVACAINGKNFNVSSAQCYAWFVFEKGHKGDTIIRWI